MFFFTNCKKEELKLNNIKWSYELEKASNDVTAAIFDPIIYEDLVIIPRWSFDDHKGELIALNKTTGDLVWTWSEAYDNYNRDGFTYKSHVYDGILTIGDNNYSAGINIYTGETIWENSINMFGFAALTGVKEHMFRTIFATEDQYFVQKGNVYTGEWETIYEFNKVDGYNLGTRTPTAVEWQGKTYIMFHRIDWRDEDGYENNIYLYFYNVTDDELAWQSDIIPLDFRISHIPGIAPVFNEGQILIANGAIYSYNMSDGQLKWKKSYGNSFALSSNLDAADGKVYGNNADGYFVCLDVHTGEEYFNVTTGWSPSRVQVLDNKCYMSAVSRTAEDVVMVLSGHDGSVLHTVTDPFLEDQEITSMQSQMTVDKETALVYAADFKNILCYDFE